MTETGVENASLPYRNTAVEAKVTEAMIRELVFAFYGKIAKDRELGPVFAEILDDDWSAHLETICAFWSAMLIRSRRGRRYKRKHVVPAHVRHASIQAEHLGQWLALFRETASEVCPPEAAAAFVDLAERVGESLALSLEKRDAKPA